MMALQRAPYKQLIDNCRQFLYERLTLASFANRIPVFFMSDAIWVVLPAGAAHMSKTLSFGWGQSAITGRKDDSPWIM